MTRIRFDASRHEFETIKKIVERAGTLFTSHGAFVDALSLTMDVTACHLNGCPLKLADLLAADDFNFIHDIGGIRRHIDRDTGKLTDCFLPRYAETCQGARADDEPHMRDIIEQSAGSAGMMFGTPPTAEEIAFLPASEALFFGAALAHIDAFYEKQRLDRIQRQNSIAFERYQARSR